MDELKLILKTGFAKRIIARIINKVIKQKIGYDVIVDLNEITVKVVDGKARLHVDLDAEMHGDDLIALAKSKDLF